MIQITDDIAIDEREIEESFVRASGPGGQNVNKLSTAVQLRFDVRRSPALPAPHDSLKHLAVQLSGNDAAAAARGGRPAPRRPSAACAELVSRRGSRSRRDLDRVATINNGGGNDASCEP